MAIQKGSYAWPSITSTAINYQTNMNALMTAIAASSTGWSVVKSATIYDTDYVFGVIEHTSGTQICFCVGPGTTPLDASNLGESGQTDDRFYTALCPARGSGFDYTGGNPRTVDWCTDAGACLFWAIYIADMHGGNREFNWRVDDDDGWLLLEYEQTVGTPGALTAFSGSGDDTLFRDTSLHDGDVYGDFMLNWRGGALADNDSKFGAIADLSGDYTEEFSGGIDRTSVNATYNPAQPWNFAEMLIMLTDGQGGKGSIDLSYLGWVREGAVANFTSLASGAYEHITDGMVWVLA